MPIFKNIFACRSSDNINQEREERYNVRFNSLENRIERLEIRNDSLQDLLRDIKTSIEMIKLRLDMMSSNQPQRQ